MEWSFEPAKTAGNFSLFLAKKLCSANDLFPTSLSASRYRGLHQNRIPSKENVNTLNQLLYVLGSEGGIISGYLYLLGALCSHGYIFSIGANA